MIVPVIVRVVNDWEARRFTVCTEPVIVTVLVPGVSVLPAPDVFQDPLTVQAPVSVIVPEAPPVIVTFVNVHAEAPAARVPPFGTTRFEPPVMLNPPVVSVPATVSEFDTSMAVDSVIVPETARL